MKALNDEKTLNPKLVGVSLQNGVLRVEGEGSPNAILRFRV